MRPAFFDTNIFLYTDDKSAPKKQSHAIDLVSKYQEQGLCIVSLQVLQEYFVIATRKFGVGADIAQKKVELMARIGGANVLYSEDLNDGGTLAGVRIVNPFRQEA